MKIALVQFKAEIKNNIFNTLKKVEKFIKQAVSQKCNLICFPEDFLFGPLDYYDSNEINTIITNSDKILTWFSKKARLYRINIIAGTIIHKKNKKLLNSCFVFNYHGEIIYQHDKQRLIPYGFENRFITPGTNKIKTFKINQIKCGVLICRELFYPELFKILRKQEVEIIFIPAFWSKRSSSYDRHQLKNQYSINSEIRVVDALCQARSFENEIALCFVNCSGKISYKNYYDILLARTNICYPFYGMIKKLYKNKENILIFDYNKSIINDARKAYQLFINQHSRHSSSS